MDDLCTIDGRRILLVDDDPDQVEMYQYALERAGVRVVVAYSGEAAMVRARELRPDAIVLDVRLPDMTGWDVCGLLKTDPITERIPIIVLTALASATLPEQAAEAGCAAHLLKPCYPDVLTATIRTVLHAAHPGSGV